MNLPEYPVKDVWNRNREETINRNLKERKYSRGSNVLRVFIICRDSKNTIEWHKNAAIEHLFYNFYGRYIIAKYDHLVRTLWWRN